MSAFLRIFERVALYMGATVLILMMFNIVADVTMRSAMNKPITGTYEVVVHWFMVAVTGFGLWAAEMKRDHIGVTLVTERMSYTSRYVHSIATRVIVILFLLALVWYGMQTGLAKMASGEYTGSAEIPIWPTRFFLPLGALAFALVGVTRLVRQLITGELDEEPELEDEILEHTT